MRRLVAAAALLAVSVPTQVARADSRSWRASWHDGTDGFRLAVTVPGRTTGRLAVPVHSRVTFDGHVVWADGKATAKGVTGDGAYVHVDGVAPGHHTMEGTR
jgi:hypothetical protein